MIDMAAKRARENAEWDRMDKSYERGRRSILDRLENPDEALVVLCHDWFGVKNRTIIEGFGQALARTLTERQEGENNDGS